MLSGGLTKTPELAQILADVFNVDVTLLESAEEGTAWGAALMAKYRKLCIDGTDLSWSAFLETIPASKKTFAPDSAAAKTYQTRLRTVQVAGQRTKELGRRALAY